MMVRRIQYALGLSQKLLRSWIKKVTKKEVKKSVAKKTVAKKVIKNKVEVKKTVLKGKARLIAKRSIDDVIKPNTAKAAAEKGIRTAKGISKLISLGKKKGFLTFEEINNALPENVVTSEEIDEILSVLDKGFYHPDSIFTLRLFLFGNRPVV